jgi:hypothetical protein
MATGNGAKTRKPRTGLGDPAQLLSIIVQQFDKLITMSNVGGAVEFGSTPLVGLPIGDFIVLGGCLNLDAIESSANIVNTFNVTTALGTVATADNALAGNEVNLLAAAAAGAAVSSIKSIKRVIAGVATPFDNNNAALAAFLNVTLPDADISGAASLRVRGTLRLLLAGLGKNA